MSGLLICRVCLTADVSMHRIINTQAKEMFEKLTSKKLRADGRPETLCYLCYSQLQKCQGMLSSYQKTKNFAQFSNSGIEITQSNIHLTMTPLQHVHVLPKIGFHGPTDKSQQVTVKIELEEEVKIEPIEFNVVFEGILYDDGTENSNIVVTKLTEHKDEYNEINMLSAKEQKKHKSKKYNEKKIQHTKPKICKVEDLNEKRNENKHRNSEKQTYPVVKAYTCKMCDSTFANKHNLQQHIRKHNGEIYTCSKCNKAFTMKNNLYRHYVSFHEQNRNYFSCDECGKEFKRCDHFKKHMKCHTGEKPHACKLCGMSFSSRSNVQQHMNSVHSDAKPFVCDKCNKSFSRKGNLQEHYRVHTGEKPYNCDLCDFKCSQQTNLRKHVLKMHYDNLADD